MAKTDPTTAYAERVLAGEIVAGELVRLACQRHLDDLTHGHRRGLRFNRDKAERVYRWFGYYHHSRGRWAKGGCTCAQTGPESCPTRLRLEPWQQFILGSIFGWEMQNERGDWVRRFGTAYNQMARKQGKSFIANGIALYMLAADGEPEPECYAAATKMEQARYVHNLCKGMLRASPALREKFKGWNHKLQNIYTDFNSSYAPLPGDSDTLDALNPHFALVDELHQHPDGRLRSVLESGMARDEPLLFEITTPGELTEDNPAKAERDYAEQILRGEVDNDSFFCYVAEPDPQDEWNDPKAWAKSNPNLGVSVDLDGTSKSLTKLCAEAESNPIKRDEFKIKRAGVWLDVADGLFDMGAWRACPKIDPESLRNRRCWGGVDLAERHDFTAYDLVFPPDDPETGVWAVLSWFWLPKETIDSRSVESRAFRSWVASGYIETGGSTLMDYRVVRDRILETFGTYDVQSVGFDPYRARQIMLIVQEQGIPVVELRQGPPTLGEATQMVEDLVIAKRLAHGNHPVLTYCARGTKARMDVNKNKVPDKKNSRTRIDGISAMVNAFACAIPGLAQAKQITGEVRFA